MTPIGWITPGWVAIVGALGPADAAGWVPADPDGATAAITPMASTVAPTANPVTFPLRTCPPRSAKACGRRRRWSRLHARPAGGRRPGSGAIPGAAPHRAPRG